MPGPPGFPEQNARSQTFVPRVAGPATHGLSGTASTLAAANAPAGGDQNGKSRFSSAASGREPYSQISKASAVFTARPFSSP